MNPWRQTILHLFRDVLRFALWLCVVINGLMLAFFSILFVHQFLRHLWSWCTRVLFSRPW